MCRSGKFLALAGLLFVVGCEPEADVTTGPEAQEIADKLGRSATTLFALMGRATIDVGNFTVTVEPGIFPFPPIAGRFKGSEAFFAGGLNYAVSPAQLILGYNTATSQTDIRNLGILEFEPGPAADHQTCGFGEEAPRDEPEPKTPLGLSLIQETFAFATPPDDDYVIIRYTLVNDGPSGVSGLHAGQVFDWVLGPALLDETTEFDVNREIAQITHGENSTVVGQVILSDPATDYDRWFFTNSPTSNAEWFDALSGGIQNPGPFGPGDINQILAHGPVTIPSGGSRSFTFALVGGDDLTDFRDNVEAARTKATDIASVPGCRRVDALVDIKPGSDPNTINVNKAKGTIPVAILTSAGFDAADVDPLSVRFGRGEAEEIHGQGHLEDVDSDGDVDLLLHFKVGDTGIRPGDVEACLEGIFTTGLLFGCDAIQTKPIISRGGLVATPIATFGGGSRQTTRLESRPDGGLLSGRPVLQNGDVVLQLLAIELDGTVALFDDVPTAGRGGLCCADYDFGSGGALYGSLSNDFTVFRRDPGGSVTYEFSNELTEPSPPFPGSGEFRNPLGMGILPSGRIVVSTFGGPTNQQIADAAPDFSDWKLFAGPGTAHAADIVPRDEDHLYVYVGLIFGDRRILEVTRGGDVREIASFPTSADGGRWGDMIPTLRGAAVGAPDNLLLAAAQSLWEINPKTGTVSERLGGFNALNGVAYGGDEKLYVLDVAQDRTTTVFRVEPGKGKAVATSEP